VRIGLALSGMAQQPQGADMGERLGELIDWVHLARDCGLDYVYTGQHFLTSPYQSLQPVPLAARLAAESGDMGLLITLLLPLLHPVDLAESLATLDWVTDGRLLVNVARGYRDEEFAAFGVHPREAAARMTECLHCLLALWSGEPVTFEGRHYRLDGAMLGLRPKQRPHPPVWVAANAEGAVLRAARLGLPWNINPHSDLATISRLIDRYRGAASEAGQDAEVALPLERELCCAPRRSEALQMAADYLGPKYATYRSWGQERVLPEGDGFAADFEELARDRFVIGTPSECAAELERYVALGVGSIHVRPFWPDMPEREARRSLELFAAEVVPRLRG
jgi:alkanesulfonate monooxygenase SsuD/methylene tetrahydromethanopterin reductase-like flavin-dependent oxidoreductase (luciferase family)